MEDQKEEEGEEQEEEDERGNLEVVAITAY